jgi:hypothetical protein
MEQLLVDPTEAGSAPAMAAVAARLGQEAKDGAFTFVVTGVEESRSLGAVTPVGKFVTLTVFITNDSRNAQAYFSGNQRIFDSTGRNFGNDTNAELSANGGAAFEGIAPGNTAIVTIVFDVPIEFSPAAVELHDTRFSRGVKIDVRSGGD